MRFLCFHGSGTCSKVFALQTARLRQELDDHEFVFVDGTFLSGPGPGANSAVSDEYYSFFPQDIAGKVDECRDLVSGLKNYLVEHGPFDGVMGFSEGGIVAAMLLVEDARTGFAGLKCGIFFSAVPPLDPAAVESGIIRVIDPAVDGVLVRVPTAHLHGALEDRAVLRVLSPLHPLFTAAGKKVDECLFTLLEDMCDPDSRQSLVHDLDHEVPGAKHGQNRSLSGALRIIERTIEDASAR